MLRTHGTTGIFVNWHSSDRGQTTTTINICVVDIDVGTERRNQEEEEK